MNPWVVGAWTGYVLLALVYRAYAGVPPVTGAVPEIDGTGAMTALGLLAGAVTLLAQRLRHK